MQKLQLITLFLAVILTPPLLEAEEVSYDDLFNQVFGKQEILPKQLKVTLLISDEFKNEIDITVDYSTNEIWIDAKIILSHLAPIVINEVLAALNHKISNNGLLTRTALSQAGIYINLNKQNLSLDITVPIDLQKSKDISLYPQKLKPIFTKERLLSPAKISGYFNLKSQLGYQHKAKPQDSSGRRPYQLEIETAMNIHGTVLESSHNYVEKADYPLIRNSTRLVRDFPKHLIRFTAGDINSPTTGYQNSFSSGGLSIVKDFQLEPQTFSRVRPEQSFRLTSRSEVEVHRDGERIRSFTLAPGEYRLTDLQLTEGSNDLSLKITDSFGEVSELNFSLFFSSQLLQPGSSTYNYSIGFPRNLVTGKYKYDSDTPTLSTFYQQGITQALTLGINAQTNQRSHLLGLNAITALAIGTLSSDIAFSSTSGKESGQAIRAQLEHHFKKIGSMFYPTSWKVLMEYKSSGFTTLTKTIHENDSQESETFPPFRSHVSSRIDFRLPHRMGFHISGDYRRNTHATGKDEYDWNVGVRRNFTHGISLSAQFNTLRQATGEYQNNFSIHYFMPLTKPKPGHHNQGIAATYNSREKSYHINHRLSPSNSIGRGSFSSRINLNHSPITKSISGSAAFRSQRIDVNGKHQLASDNTNQKSSRSDININTALVYADGHFQLSRPVSNSFILFKTDTSVANSKIPITYGSGYTGELNNERPTHYLALADASSLGIVPEISAYSYRHYNADMSRLPLGTDTSKSEITLLSGYRTGFVADIGGALGVMAGGVLLAPDGNPVNLKGGQVTNIDKNNPSTTPFFTNRKGKFRLLPLPPGRYMLEVFEHPDFILEFEIPEKSVGGFHDIGTNRLGNNGHQSKK